MSWPRSMRLARPRLSDRVEDGVGRCQDGGSIPEGSAALHPASSSRASRSPQSGVVGIMAQVVELPGIRLQVVEFDLNLAAFSDGVHSV